MYSLNWDGATIEEVTVKMYWDKVFAGECAISENDWHHLIDCRSCQNMVLRGLADHRMKVTTDLMSHIGGEFRERVIRVICLGQIPRTEAANLQGVTTKEK